MKLMLGDCLLSLRKLPDNSIDSVVTDPPYGLSFMGKKWDYDVPSLEIWQEVFRVLKPGGHVLSFCGTRTYHRMVVRIEDAGFEIRDQLQWIYGSGFPKSMDVSKAIDKAAGAEREVIGEKSSKGRVKAEGWGMTSASVESITAPSTDAAKQWQGWGTALKPANEPISLARKPIESKLTVAQNVLKYGTGGLNIDASRIAAADQAVPDAAVKRMTGNKIRGWVCSDETVQPNSAQGRFPANIILSEDAAAELDAQSGNRRSAGNNPSASIGTGNGVTYLPTKHQGQLYSDSGGASRFFYVAKASKRERNAGLEGMPKKLTGTQHEINIPVTGVHGTTGKPNKPMEPQQNFHPTVKPIKLMQYLITLITPPGGTVLDPFMGSGTTGVAAKQLGFDFIGCELSNEYLAIAKARIKAAK